MSETNSDVGQRIQEKFQFYILGLIFTLLGLAVQTAVFGASIVADVFELTAWIFFLVSALVMMSRLEWTPQIYHLFDLQQELKTEQNKLRQVIAAGAQVVDTVKQPIENPTELLYIFEERLNITSAQIGKIDKGAQWKYNVHKAGFVLGLMCLITSRAYIPISSIISRIYGLS